MSGKIVIVDDDAIIRSLFQKFFSDAFQLFAAAEGYSALKLIKGEKPDLVFLDIDMPGLSGLDVLRNIKEAGLTPVVWMLTGKGQLEVITEAINLGAAGYLTKPFEVAKIRKIVDSILTPGAEKPSDRPWVVKRSGKPGPGKSGQENP